MRECTFRTDHTFARNGVCLICGARWFPPDLTAARAASEAVTIATLRDEINVLRAELHNARLVAESWEHVANTGLETVRELRALLPDPATHTHDGIRRDKALRVGHDGARFGGYRDEGI